jgi:hypothetical protein
MGRSNEKACQVVFETKFNKLEVGKVGLPPLVGRDTLKLIGL